ncbi:hypothetical protein [Alicyclobacillus macrosporangiidus]|uniref:Haemolysin XhlA n=1 Tax=Alicyclobacillus macrosporangiidus TaxID=392015 RepID=A0A1I7IET3_9BACL|nr:hypothetical protein [Alicyclobacillus macrosporangiidus]SFU71422.1 hypothetical protein SAMN05421543_106177 [Alicyclobacillus macrosporangiidus]
MTVTVEERLSTLEAGFQSLKEGLDRVERALEKLDGNVAVLIEKLDARYPSQESVNLRFTDLQQKVAQLETQCEAQRKDIDQLRNWQYKVTGGIAVVAFLLGLVSSKIPPVKW